MCPPRVWICGRILDTRLDLLACDCSVLVLGPVNLCWSFFFSNGASARERGAQTAGLARSGGLDLDLGPRGPRACGPSLSSSIVRPWPWRRDPCWRALRRRPWRGSGRLAGRVGPRRAVGLAVELPRAVLRASSSAAGEQAERARPSPPAAGVSEVGTSSRSPARPSPAATVSAAAGRSGSGGGGGAGAERQRQRSSSRTVAGARRRPCWRRRASSLVLVPPPSPGARRSPPSSLLSPPSSLLRPRPNPAWAMRAPVEARALRWRTWCGGGRRGLRRRSGACGSRPRGGRARPAEGRWSPDRRPRFFSLTWHDVVPGNDTGIVF